MKRIYKALLIVVIIMVISAIQNTKASDFVNPIPEAYTDAEIQTLYDRYKQTGASTVDSKVFVNRNGTMYHINMNDPIKDAFIQEGDILSCYAVIAGMANVYNHSIDFAVQSPELYAIYDGNSERIFNKDQMQTIKPKFDTKIFYGDQSRIIENSDNRFAVRFTSQDTKPQFIKCEVKLPSLENIGGVWFNISGISRAVGTSNPNGGHGVSTSFRFYPGPFQTAKTIFHYVSEKDYRKALGLSDSDAIKPRSYKDGDNSNKAFIKLNIPDIISPVESISAFGRKNGFVTRNSTLLAPETPPNANDEQANPENYFEPNFKNVYQYTTTRKPKLSQLLDKANSVNGRSYVANDIDYVHDDITDSDLSNNKFANWGVIDSKVSREKHYYILLSGDSAIPPTTPVISKSAPKTGDTSNIFVLITLAFTSLALAVIIYKKQYK